ncbi:HAD-like domain-containing protein [Hyaloraphidium curvatum]|nr:HAD-like domain-containing protein [Hyaloraphidium curvatum]
MGSEAVIDTLPDGPPSRARKPSISGVPAAHLPPKTPSDPRSPDISPPLPDPARIKLVVSDVDGTLLDPHHELTEGTARTIRKLLAARPDLRFVICTGKARPATLGIRERLGLDEGRNAGRHPSIHTNGCVTYSGDGKVLKETTIAKSVGDWLLRLVEGYPSGKPDPLLAQLTLAPYVGDVVRVSRASRFADLLRDAYGETVLVHSDDQKDEDMGTAEYHARLSDGSIAPNKWCICGEDAPLDAFRDLFLREDGVPPELRGLFTLTEAVPHILELCPPTTSKGTALQELLGSMGLEPDECLACGDGDNDAPMFEVAGYSTAMKKSMRRARELATWWEPHGNGEDGLAKWLEAMFQL